MLKNKHSACILCPLLFLQACFRITSQTIYGFEWSIGGKTSTQRKVEFSSDESEFLLTRFRFVKLSGTGGLVEAFYTRFKIHASIQGKMGLFSCFCLLLFFHTVLPRQPHAAFMTLLCVNEKSALTMQTLS